MRVPEPVSRLLARLPVYPACWAFTRGLNAMLAPQLAGDVRAALEGKRFWLTVVDIELVLMFGWVDGRFVPVDGDCGADLAIGARAHDLWLMLRREEDPDTLFFGRRLSIEGDTELALLFKNTLDGLELPGWLR